ncbi:unnamed protein product [Symbiodinium sp. CCMP2456]|nr:unnamed protein product [Symbiodinium sp. CCMP2456]
MRRGEPRSTQWLAWLSLEMLFAASTACILVASMVPFAVVLRGLPLLRILYIQTLWECLSARHLRPWIQRRSLEARFFGNLLLAVMAGALLLHMVTCTWYAVGDRPGGWVRHEGLESSPQSVQYRMAAEWALSRLPPSRLSDNMLLKTQEERGVAFLITTLAVVFASIFTSIVTNDISDIRRAHKAQRKSHVQLSNYLAAFPVPWDLEKELQAYLHRNQSLVQLPQKQEMASLLPAFLYRELCREALSPVIAKHDFFSGLQSRYASFHMNLCVECLREWHLATEEILFSNGPRCQSMMFVASGEVAYRKLPPEFATSPVSARNELLQHNFVVPTAASATIVEEKLGFGDWMCEQCLWTEWHFLGRAVSTQGATVLCLADETLMRYAGLHKEVMAELLIYCRILVEVLNGVADDDFTDLPISMEDVRPHPVSLP